MSALLSEHKLFKSEDPPPAPATMMVTTALVRSSLRTLRHSPTIPSTRRVYFLSTSPDVEPILDSERLQQRLQTLAPSMALSLIKVGFWTNNPQDPDESLVTDEEVQAIRQQSIALRHEGRFEQSMSEITTDTGEIRAFPKEGVFACEPDGQDYYTAPDLLMYMSTIIQLLPPLLNHAYKDLISTNDATIESPLTLSHELQLSNQAFNAKLAVTSPGGSVYPLHVDNTLGIKGSPQDDSRKLTCILYLNPIVEGGDLRLYLEDGILDLSPDSGRVVMFWSDEIPHEVLPCAPHESSDEEEYDRYALTVWIPTLDPRNIQPPGSKFQSLREQVF